MAEETTVPEVVATEAHSEPHPEAPAVHAVAMPPVPAPAPKVEAKAPAKKAQGPEFNGKAPQTLNVGAVAVSIAHASVAEQTKREAISPTGAELFMWTATIKGNACGSLVPVTAVELVPAVEKYLKNAGA